MTNFERQGHVALGFVGGVPKHHALITSALGFGCVFFDALVNVRRLFVDGRNNPAGIGIEHVFGFGITNATNRIAGDQLSVHIACCFDFTGQDGQARCDQGFAGNFGAGILGQEGIQEGVRYLVGDFVGMAFGNGFGGEEIRHKQVNFRKLMGLLEWAKVGTKARKYQIFDPKIGLGIPKAPSKDFRRRTSSCWRDLAVLAVQPSGSGGGAVGPRP